MATPLSDPPLASLIAAHQSGYALPRDFYVSPDIYARDLELLQNRWIYAGHISELAKAGDWITAELANDSAIVIRDATGTLKAFANVCRHRGSRLCVGTSGNAKLLVCPYHAWTYTHDGALRAAPQMPAGFVAAEHGLHPLPLAVIGGLIFISFGAQPPALDTAGPALTKMFSRYQWPTAKIAHRALYPVKANWKLDLENYHECYHCTPQHPEFAQLHALARPGQRTLAIDADASGYADVEDWSAEANGREPVRMMRSALSEGCHTGSKSGALLAPLMGPDDGHCLFGELGFLSAFLAYADYGVIYRFAPKGLAISEIEVIWLVSGDAVEGRDYDLAALTWLWDVTSIADKRIIETNQAGVASRFYSPGPFSTMEPGARQFVDRYLAELAASL